MRHLPSLMMMFFMLLSPSANLSATTYPLTMPNGLGGTITLTRRPERIVSLAPNATEILFAIGAGDRVVGVTRYCNYPREAQRLPKIGGYASDISIEAVVALSPDLVIANRGNPRTTLAALSSHGLKILVAIEAESFAEIQRALARVGRATDNEQQAAKVVQDMTSTISAVRKAVANVEPRRVYFGSLAAPYRVAGPSSFIGECIQLAGGRNIAWGLEEPWPILSVETILERDPEVVIEGFHVNTGGAADQYRTNLLSRLRADRVWSQITAVRKGDVYVLDDDTIHRPGPRLAQAVAGLARLLYPERFPPHGDQKPH